MNSLIILIVAAVSASALPTYNLLEDENGQQYYAIPVHRTRRQAQTTIGAWGPGVQAGVKHEGTIIDNDSYRLDGSASFSKQFADNSPFTAQGKLEYLHKDSGSGISATATQPLHGGTDLDVQGKYNVYQNGNFGVDVTGGYERHYGGPQGTGSPDWNTMIQGHYDLN